MNKQKQIEKMAKVIGDTWLVDLEGETKDVCEVLDEVDIKAIARELYEQDYRKLPKDSVVLSKEEYEMHITQYKNLEIKYSNLSDNYRLCKDANETIKQFAVIARKETAKEILSYVGNLYDDCDQRFKLKDYAWHKRLCEKYGVEVEE